MVNGIETTYPCGSVRDSVWAPEFDMKHLKKAEEHISTETLWV